MEAKHIPVLLQEVIEGLAIATGDIVVDATIDGGGMSEALCEHLGKRGLLVGIDLDTTALSESRKRLSGKPCRIKLEQANFRDIDRVLARLGIHRINRAIFDLGMSTKELLASGRGFSFQKNEPLIMTYNIDPKGEDLTAGYIVNHWNKEHIADVLYGYGEERFARRIAQMIVDSRKESPIKTTFDLVSIIKRATPVRFHHGRRHVATKTFQALRIAVNDELEALTEALEKTHVRLSTGGRIAVISYHSLEDRIVKNFFRSCAQKGKGKIITKKPIVPELSEIRRNPASRSAKLRIFERS